MIADAFGRPGFPNIFNPTAAQSLGYAAAMLEAGVPVIYVYVADAHDRNPLPVDPVTGRAANAHAFGPGEAEYVAQLKAYDQAFGAFFARLAADGITKDNTLFIVVPDENDHFVGSQPTPVGCDGVHVPCNYVFASEIDAHINRLLATRNPATPAFSVHSDDAPTFYVNGNPAPTDAVTRQMEHDLDALIATNPITTAVDKLSFRLADQAEMKLLHMVTKSPARTPTFTMFGDDNYFFFTAAGGDCVTGPACVFVPVSPAATFAWNHGDVQPDITRSWLAMVGTRRAARGTQRPRLLRPHRRAPDHAGARSASRTPTCMTAACWPSGSRSTRCRTASATASRTSSSSPRPTSSSTRRSARSAATASCSPTARSSPTTPPTPGIWRRSAPSRPIATRSPARSRRRSTTPPSRASASTSTPRTISFAAPTASSTRSRISPAGTTTITIAITTTHGHDHDH